MSYTRESGRRVGARSRFKKLAFVGALTAAALLGCAPPSVRLLVPQRGNLQQLAFWLARGGGLFAERGVDVKLVVPDHHRAAAAALEKGEADLAVLPAPLFLMLVESRAPFVAVASLLRRDPIDLVVGREVAAARGLDDRLPLGERLRRLRGLRIGVAPNPITRLRALFRDHGLEADTHLRIEILRGPAQNAALREGRVDGLYAHTPYLERALSGTGARLVVAQSRGDGPPTFDRAVHLLVTSRAYLARHRDVVGTVADALGRAACGLRVAPDRALGLLRKMHPERGARELETLVQLYAPATIGVPILRSGDLARSLELYPARRRRPVLDEARLEAAMDRSLVLETPPCAAEASRGPTSPPSRSSR